MTTSLHQETKRNSERLADSIEQGGLDLQDAIIQAMLADGFEFADAAKAFNVVSLAYEVRRRAYADGKNDTAR